AGRLDGWRAVRLDGVLSRRRPQWYRVERHDRAPRLVAADAPDAARGDRLIGDPMRIVAVRDIVSPIRSNIANAYIDFSQMTASVVAVVTDLEVEGKPVVGYGFNSNGRYAQHGLLNERFIKRVTDAKSDSLLDGDGLIDPAKCWKAMMANEKPGGHGERSVAVGMLDMALWDAVAKTRRVPLWKLLADRYNDGKYDDKAWVYAAGGYYYPGKDLDGLQDEMKHY